MALLADIQWPLYTFALGLAIVTGILLRRSRAYFSARARSKRESIGVVPRTAAASAVLAHQPPQSAQRWEVELHERARELTARLDNKIIILQQLIAEAERVAERLERGLSVGAVATEKAAKAPVPMSAPDIAKRNAHPVVPQDAFHAAYRATPGQVPQS